MRYEQVKELDNEKFRRLTGVKKATFERMIEFWMKKIGARRQKVEEKASYVQKTGYLWH